MPTDYDSVSFRKADLDKTLIEFFFHGGIDGLNGIHRQRINN
jgi:hypothetical protein